jgi:hypothetical protein
MSWLFECLNYIFYVYCEYYKEDIIILCGPRQRKTKPYRSNVLIHTHSLKFGNFFRKEDSVIMYSNILGYSEDFR